MHTYTCTHVHVQLYMYMYRACINRLVKYLPPKCGSCITYIHETRLSQTRIILACKSSEPYAHDTCIHFKFQCLTIWQMELPWNNMYDYSGIENSTSGWHTCMDKLLSWICPGRPMLTPACRWSLDWSSFRLKKSATFERYGMILLGSCLRFEYMYKEQKLC